MKIIDAHTHIFPPKIAEKATKSIGDFYGFDHMFSAAATDKLIEAGDKIGVEKYLVCSSAVTPGQASHINKFIAQECKKDSRLVGFAALHPLMKNYEEELERCIDYGLKGVKIHSDFQRVEIDRAEAIDFYRAIAEKGLPVLFHMGDARYDYSSPERLMNLMEKVPELKVIAAHFGGYKCWDRVLSCEPNENLYFDTSSSLTEIDINLALKLISKFGEDKFLFGSDFPMWSPEEELERFLALDLGEEVNSKILYDNFINLFEL